MSGHYPWSSIKRHKKDKRHNEKVVLKTETDGKLEGKRFDQGKSPMSLLPFAALKEVGNVLLMGEKKYGSWNWVKGMKWSRVENSMLRHYEAYQSGEEHDKESGLLHTAHMACNALFLLTYQLLDLGEDDRPKGLKSSEEE